MLRHEFRPGKLIAGLFLTAAGVVYVGDARNAWEAPWFAVIPLVIGGLCLAGAVGLLNHAIRGRGTSGGTGPTGPTGYGSAAGPSGAAMSAGATGPGGTADSEGVTGPSGSVG
ncbi:hypothetical protein H4687_005632 [Streptomyces stelliscabiei]|uniref:Uncharacterized protein n=1 Tax=Streptomyces stelliscabiei TaxID=146820 RepID=A0A8I0P4Q5_9ACTN|nr:hypothetical protein [Streptomyces stelliscabiei]